MSKSIIKSLKNIRYVKIFQNFKKIWEIILNVQNIQFMWKSMKKGEKILKNVKNPPKFIKNPSKFLNILKIMQNVWTIQKKWKYALKCQNPTYMHQNPWNYLTRGLFWYRRQTSKKQNFFNFCFSQARWRKNWKNFVFWMSGLVFI